MRPYVSFFFYTPLQHRESINGLRAWSELLRGFSASFISQFLLNSSCSSPRPCLVCSTLPYVHTLFLLIYSQLPPVLHPVSMFLQDLVHSNRVSVHTWGTRSAHPGLLSDSTDFADDFKLAHDAFLVNMFSGAFPSNKGIWSALLRWLWI